VGSSPSAAIGGALLSSGFRIGLLAMAIKKVLKESIVPRIRPIKKTILLFMDKGDNGMSNV
jgi:hypothetical protein